MANYPSSQNTDDNLYIAVNNLSTVLTDNPLSSGAVTVNVSDTTGFPSVGIITIDLEAISYTGTTATSFTGCTRGADGTTAASHLVNATVFHDIPAAHHNVLKDEIKAVTDDLRDAFTADLDDGVSPATTATDLKARLDHLVTQLKNVTGEADWKTSPATTLSLVDSVKSALDDADTPAATASDIKDRLDQIVSQLKLITGETNWYDAPDNTIAALETDKAEDADVVKLTGNQSIAGEKTFTGQLIGKGTDTNDNATAGYIGETVKSVVTSNTNFPTTGNWGDLTSISLDPGDWLITVLIRPNTATSSTTTYIAVGSSTTAGNFGTGITLADNAVDFSGAALATNERFSITVPGSRLAIASGGPVTVYLKFQAIYSAGQPVCTGRISAVRIR